MNECPARARAAALQMELFVAAAPCSPLDWVRLSSSSLWAASTVRAAGAVVVGTEVHDLATEGAAVVDQGLVVLDGVVDEGLVLLDGHLEKWLEIFGTRGDGGGKRRDVCLCL